MKKHAVAMAIFVAVIASPLWAQTPEALRVGVAGHAFDHLGAIADQADTAAASGENIIYTCGVGALGYEGLPDIEKLKQAREQARAYMKSAKAKGIRLVIGYVCATSIVGLESFDKNWMPEFRAQLKSHPAQWLQVDKNGHPLPSWYGAPYQPACMNNPDWRAYEKYMIRQELEAGGDGIFFDNPTVHPNGCYCRFCMEKFAAFMGNAGAGADEKALRQLAVSHPREFMKFRSTIGRDFIAEMRAYARRIQPKALITCNNSLNSPDVFFSQIRSMGYDIEELSKAEDFVLLEDMSTQPRAMGDGRTVEYGSMYKQVNAISHGKPVVAVTIADADYHTPPNLVRLAMAEAAANDASYLCWPTWPENVRAKMAESIRPEADFLRRNEPLLNETKPRADVVLLLCFQRWLDTDTCAATPLAAALERKNIQFTVCSEDDLGTAIKSAPVLLIESFSFLTLAEKQIIEKFQKRGGHVIASDDKDWQAMLQKAVEKPSIVVQGPPEIRAVVRDQHKRVLAHLYNLNVLRLSSYEDKVIPAKDVEVKLRLPFSHIHSVKALTSDVAATVGELPFIVYGDEVEIKIPRLEISTILVVE